MSQRGSGTIVARATPPGRGGLAVIRLSGPAVRLIATQLLGTLPAPRVACLTAFGGADGQPIDTGIALFFPGPASFTGEDVLELHAHGSPIVCELLVGRALELGARLAEPGEFTERAFLNDKLDLSQAEAIADLIDAGTAAAARAAVRSLRGDFSAAILRLNDQLTDLRVWVEAALDFPDEDIDFLGDAELRGRLDEVASAFRELERVAIQGCILRDGAQVVLTGRPNAGKSSILNVLAGYAAAIVTEVPGTTRDPVRESLDLDGLPVHVVDTAGLHDSQDLVEQEGVRRARSQLASADLALVIVDARRERTDVVEALRAELPRGLPHVTVRNKIDLTGEPPGPLGGDPDVLNVSARTGQGISELRARIKSAVGFEGAGEGTLTARQRHVDSLRRAQRHFELARDRLSEDRAGELMADELVQAQNALAEITGEFTSEDLLGRIFASFCIGK